jgi:AraC-like DNA-binding protein
VASDPKLVLPGAHPLWAAGVANVFQMLRVSAALTDGALWRVIHEEPSVTGFELEHGVEIERDKYNGRCLAEVRTSQRPVLGTHASLSDWWVPIIVGGRVEAVLVTGPFEMSRPTSADILSRWRRLTGRQGHPSDPEFMHYVSMTLATLVLSDGQAANFERLLTQLALLMAGETPARALLDRIDALWEKLEGTRLVERIWDAAHDMVDARTARRWSRPHEARGRALFGLPAMPDQALVGLVVRRQAGSEPVDELLGRDAWQRQCVELARRSGHAISGRVGDHGVVFLSAASGTAQRRRQRLVELAEKAAAIAKRLGFGVHMGTSALPPATPLPEQFQAALGAAERALSDGTWIVHGSLSSKSGLPLAELRRQLGKLVEDRPMELPVRFEHYQEAVARASGYRLEPARAHLEAGFERMTEALVDHAGVAPVLEALDRSARDARTVAELSACYRRAVADLVDAIERPNAARRDRSLRRALEYIRAHYTEPLTLAAVAKVAGFAPNYFSALWKQHERTTFARSLRDLRLERAKELLATTELAIERVAALSGLGTRQYMARVFQRAVGTTPRESRRRLRPTIGSKVP